VFIFFSDHGAEGLIAFPSSELMATELNNGLKKMHDENRYNKLVIYIEACEAGSMFNTLLPDDIAIFAVTASNERESSYATYYDEKRGAYLGDEFSVNWMEDSDDHPDLSKETLQQQFKAAKERTKQSHVTQYGDKSLGNLPVSQFQGEKVATTVVNQYRRYRHQGSVPSQDVPLIVAQKKAEAHPEDQRLQSQYQTIVNGRSYVDDARRFIGQQLVQSFGLPVEILTQKATLTQHECYETLFKTFDEHCFDVSSHPYALRSLPLLVNVCESMKSQSLDDVFGVGDVASFIAKECIQHVKEHPFTSIV